MVCVQLGRVGAEVHNSKTVTGTGRRGVRCGYICWSLTPLFVHTYVHAYVVIAVFSVLKHVSYI